jgi:hypothetical protein
MGGAGMLIVGGAVQVIGGIIAVLSCINLLMKTLYSSLRRGQIRSLPRKLIMVEEAGFSECNKSHVKSGMDERRIASHESGF